MRALRVRAVMASSVAIPKSHDVHLDALLAWVWMLRHHPDRMGSLAQDVRSDQIIRAHLPVASVPVGRHDVPLCSAWSFSPDARLGTTRWTRRKDGEDMNQRARRLSGSCPDRPQFNRADCVTTPWVEWIVWGSRREVRKSLELVHQIGGLRGHGYGRVTSWSVDHDDHTPSETWIADGISQRNLPALALESETVDRLAVAPPYWPRCEQVPAVRPGVAVTLRAGIAEDLAGGGRRR